MRGATAAHERAQKLRGSARSSNLCECTSRTQHDGGDGCTRTGTEVAGRCTKQRFMRVHIKDTA
eukprot:365316-Chlamydomonas_euryale.AAC.3